MRPFPFHFPIGLVTGIYTYTDLRGAQDRAWRGVKYAVDCGGSRSSLVCVSLGEANDAIEEEATCASLLGSPLLGNDTDGGSTTTMDIGEEASESYGKTSFLTILRRTLKVIQKHRETGCEGVHTKEGEAENLTVSHGSSVVERSLLPVRSFYSLLVVFSVFQHM